MIYTFNTTATMKPYNRDKWYITSNYIREIKISAETKAEAFAAYLLKLENDYYIEVSKTAAKNKSVIYYDDRNGDPIPSGYCVTASTAFQNDAGDLKKQYIDLWIDILTFA